MPPTRIGRVMPPRFCVDSGLSPLCAEAVCGLCVCDPVVPAGQIHDVGWGALCVSHTARALELVVEVVDSNKLIEGTGAAKLMLVMAMSLLLLLLLLVDVCVRVLVVVDVLVFVCVGVLMLVKVDVSVVVAVTVGVVAPVAVKVLVDLGRATMKAGRNW
mmetsp:Transcript_122701/g.244084  ORF Transcript_122701/g.244084 Transcript_122701/m.244084 type:complete len:159 (-) Transcript_122701:222-698(-)